MISAVDLGPHSGRATPSLRDAPNRQSIGRRSTYLTPIVVQTKPATSGAGPVGGYAQAGKWRLDARFDREKQASTVRALAPFRSHITMSRLDALDFLSHSLKDDRALTYLDPPYYVKGSKLYRNAYAHDDHVAVKDAVQLYRDSKWVVSYDAVAPILDIYSDFDPILYSLNYSAGAVGSGREVIYLSDPLAIPAIEGFERRVA